MTGSVYSADPGVDRHHLISISSYHTMKIHTLSFPTFGLTRSVRDIVDPRNWVDPHGCVVSYLLTFLCSSGLNVEGTRGEIFAASPIAIPRQTCTQRTHCDIWSKLATTPECVLKKGDRQSEKKWRNGDRRAICYATRGIDAGRGVFRHQGVSNCSDGARPL